jgi:membrane protein YqaA with SNARE-associated domain
MKPLRQIVSDTKTHIKSRIDRSRLYDAGLGFWILLILVFIVGLIFLVYIKEFIAFIISDFGYLGILITSFITDLIVQPVGPDVPLLIGIFAGLNPWMVFLVVLLGSYLALFVAYYIGETLGAAGIEKIMGKKNFARLEKYSLTGKWFMFIGALTPVPYIPYLAGLWKFNFAEVIIYVIVPRTLRFAVVLLFGYYLGIALA